MATKVVMEALSPTMEEGRLVEWHKREGDAVTAGDVLAEVETDKAVMELPARADGVLRKVLVQAGGTVPTGTLLAVIAGADEDISALLKEAGSGKREAPAAPGAAAPAAPAAPAGPVATVTPAPTTAPGPTLPASRFPLPGGVEGGGRVKASPLARRIARERGLNLAVLRGSGPGGRIIKRDLDGPLAGPPAISAAAASSAAFEDVPLTQIRKTIARRLAESLGPVPHFFLTVEVDMERAWEAREALNALGEEPKVSLNDIIVKAVAQALRQHRDCNPGSQGDVGR